MGTVSTGELLSGLSDAQKDDKFNYVINFILNNEGGYVFNVNDSGGETNFGITKKSYPDLDIKSLTKNSAIEIYRRDYWLRYPFSEINDVELCKKIFDSAVNMGYAQAAKLLQRAHGGLTQDGMIGPQSIKAINNSDPHDLLAKYRATIGDFYVDLAIKNPKNMIFLKGWIRRAYL